MLSIQNLSVSAGKKPILTGVSFTFSRDRVYALLGPNGSGKSTLAHTLLGNPEYTVKRGGKILFGKPARHASPARSRYSVSGGRSNSGGKNLISLTTDERARLGIFLSFQSPLPLAGVSVIDLLRVAMEKKITPIELRNRIHEYAKELHIKDELLKRSLNEGFSGGEKKKLEALQCAMLNPKIALFDELDTGVDFDALKLIVRFLKKHLSSETTQIFITHSPRLLKAIHPDTVLVMKEGKIVKTGTKTLAKKIEAKGFDWIK